MTKSLFSSSDNLLKYERLSYDKSRFLCFNIFLFFGRQFYTSLFWLTNWQTFLILLPANFGDKTLSMPKLTPLIGWGDTFSGMILLGDSLESGRSHIILGLFYLANVFGFMKLCSPMREEPSRLSGICWILFITFLNVF